MDSSYVIINTLSIFGCVGIFIGGYLTKHSLTTATKLILLLSFSDFLFHCSNITIYFLTGDQSIACSIAWFICNLSILLCYLWSCSLALFAYLTLRNPKRTQWLNSLVYFIVAWVVISILYALMYSS